MNTRLARIVIKGAKMQMHNFPVILACGPGIPVTFVYEFLAAAGVVVSSFMWGLVSLFTGSIKLGLGLISFSAVAVFAFLAFTGLL